MKLARPPIRSLFLSGALAVTLFTVRWIFAYDPGPIADEFVTRTYKIEIGKLRLVSAPSETSTQYLRNLIASVGVSPVVISSTNTVVAHSPATSVAFVSPPQRSMFFNDLTGELRIRATRRDIPKIEKVIQPFWKSEVVTPFQADITVVNYLSVSSWKPEIGWKTLGTSFTNLMLLAPQQNADLLHNLQTNADTHTFSYQLEKIRIGKTTELMIDPQAKTPITVSTPSPPFTIPPSTTLIIRGDSH